jgi:hypothetical protein
MRIDIIGWRWFQINSKCINMIGYCNVSDAQVGKYKIEIFPF